MVLSKSTLLR